MEKKRTHTCALYSTLCGQKGQKHKVTLFMGPKKHKLKLCLDEPAK
jgi:hypothetical protein